MDRHFDDWVVGLFTFLPLDVDELAAYRGNIDSSILVSTCLGTSSCFLALCGRKLSIARFHIKRLGHGPDTGIARRGWSAPMYVWVGCRDEVMHIANVARN